MGNAVQFLKDPALVRSIQEAWGVRQITIEVKNEVYAPPESAFDSQSSAEDSGEENFSRTNSVDGQLNTASEVTGPGLGPEESKEEYSSVTSKKGKSKKGGALSWLKSKGRVRKRIPTPPPRPQGSQESNSLEPPSIENVASSQVIVVETIPFLDIYFRLATEVGYEPFYITFIPFLFWNVDTFLARHTIICWCMSMYIGQVFKQIFKIKRPASPPVIRLEQNPVLETEYGFPSTHATVGTTIPFCLLYHTVRRYQVSSLFSLRVSGNCPLSRAL